MLEPWRTRFNAAYHESAYRSALAVLESRCGGVVPFRIAESPIFLPAGLVQRMDQASREILGQLAVVPGYRDAVARRLPEGALIACAPSDRGQAEPPLFLMLDYALAEGPDGGVIPLLTELQGFPSLFAFQYELSRLFREAYALPAELPFLAPGLDEDAFLRLFRRAVFGDHAPETVVLLEVRPWEQGTWPDFRLTERLCPGVTVVDALDVKVRGRRLYRVAGGREVPIERVYWRIVWDDLQAYHERLAFDIRDDLELEWAGHPDDFFLAGKVSLPFLRHPCVPEAHFLDELPAWPQDVSGWVLKPLFSLSGRGVHLDVDRGLLDAIPERERRRYLLQRKFRYADVIRALEGRVRCEARLMYVWSGQPVLTMVLPRMSRGRLMGCGFNKTDPWTGHGVAFLP